MGLFNFIYPKYQTGNWLQHAHNKYTLLIVLILYTLYMYNVWSLILYQRDNYNGWGAHVEI